MDHLNEDGVSVEDEILRNADEAETEDMMEKEDREKAGKKEKTLEKAEKAEEKTEEKGLTRQEKEAEEALKKSAEKMMKEADRKKSAFEELSAGRSRGSEPGQNGKDKKEDRRPPRKDPKDLEIEELEDRLKRNLAEFDNFRKRTEKEKAAMFDMGAKDILEKLLPVIDNFERSLDAAPDTEECKAYTEGMKMIYRQLIKNMEDAGVKPMDCKGKPFDPAYHNAVMHVEDESLGENEVAEELQKGYLYKDSVLRHSMVKVAN